MRPSKHLKHNFLLYLLAFVGIASLLTFRNMISIEVGLIGAVADVIFELWGTKEGLWTYYQDSVYKIGGRLPIEITLSYFFLGILAANYIFFRLGL